MRRGALAAASAAAAAAAFVLASAAAPALASPARGEGMRGEGVQGIAARGNAPPAVAARGTVDTMTFWSPSLGVHKRALVWRPPSYDTSPSRRYPSAYYLHGLWGSEFDWTTSGNLHLTLDSLAAAGAAEMIVVMPDGDDGWYTTWNRLLDVSLCRRDFKPRAGDASERDYCVPWSHYDDYVARDLVAAVDARYRTIADRRSRGIAGLSMGGYGAVTLALRYPEVWSAAASHSGVLSPMYAGTRPFDGRPRYAASVDSLRAGYKGLWGLIAPAFGNDTAAWWSREPVRLLERLTSTDRRRLPALFLDCGTEDGLVDHARSFRAELTRLGVAHEYAEWPGKHDWPYWQKHAATSAAWMARQLSSGS